MNMGRALERYSATIKALEEAQPRPSPQQILAVLKARDHVQTALADKEQDSVDDLSTVLELDRRLKLQAARIAQAVGLEEWRASLQPSEEAWWWFMQLPPRRWDRFDWLWTPITVLCLIIALGLVVDISSRFIAGGPDTWAAMTVVGQSVLTLLTAGGTLTLAGQEVIKRVLASFKIPEHFWHEAKFAIALLLLAGLVLLRFSLPGIALWYNNQGLRNYLAGNLTSAQSDYLRAVKLNPDSMQAHYNLAVLYEDLQQMDKARVEYRAAVQGGLDAAHNNLARLYILEENYSAAVPLLKKGLSLTENEEVRYDLYKNLGWARLGQARYEEASLELHAAVTLSPEKAPAHCLLAQVLEGRGDLAGASGEWELCLKLADPLRPDEDTWIGMARQRITVTGE